MLTASETRQLSAAAQELDQIDETLIYKYRDEFLHIQSAAVKGLTKLEMLVEDPQEFSQVCTAWGFSTVIQDKISAQIIYSKAQNSETIERTTSNITVDWTSPKPTTIDVEYYRSSGDLVKLANSRLSIPLLTTLKNKFSIGEGQYEVAQSIIDQVGQGTIPEATKTGVGAEFAINIQTNSRYTLAYINKPGSGYQVGDKIAVPPWVFGQPDTNRWAAIITVEGVADQRLINPSRALRGSVTNSLYIIEPGGITSVSIEGTTSPTIITARTVTWTDSQLTGSTKGLY